MIPNRSTIDRGTFPQRCAAHGPSAKRAFHHLAFIAFICAPFSPAAQDIHFSQFFNTPLALGPGTMGAFDGNYRLNGIFRQQWRSVTTPYRTFAFGGDAANVAGVNGLGLGSWLHNDRAGDSQLEQFHFSIGASWTERFGHDRAHAITGGFQIGLTSITIDPGSLTFDSQYNGFYFDPDLNSGEQFDRSGLVHADLHVGAVYRYRTKGRTSLQFGGGLFNLTEPEIGFQGGPGSPLDKRTSVHFIGQFPIATAWDVLPMARYMSQGTFRELDLGANFRYILLDRYGLKRALLFGVHHRFADAAYLHAGLEHDDWTFGLSYDVNTSRLVPASRNRGAIEFTVIRILRDLPSMPVRFKACPAQL